MEKNSVDAGRRHHDLEDAERATWLADALDVAGGENPLFRRQGLDANRADGAFRRGAWNRVAK